MVRRPGFSFSLLQHRRRGRLAVVGALASVTLAAAGCGSSSTAATGTTSAAVTTTTVAANTSTASTAAGSSTSAAATTAPSTGGAGETIGVTPTTISIGVVADLTGPVPGIFKSAPDTIDAFAAYINSTGGINGRKLKVVRKDSAFDCVTNKNVTQQLAGSVFADVGSFSISDGCEIPVLQANPDFPSVAYALDPRLYPIANVFSPQPAPPGYRTTDFTFFKAKYPAVITKSAWLYSSSAAFTFQEQQAASESVGYKTIYARGVGPTETQFTADILRMKSDGVQFVDLTNFSDTDIANFVNESRQQSFHPTVVYAPPAYDANFMTVAQSTAAQGIWVSDQFALFLGEDSASVPEVATYLKWLQIAHPGDRADIYGAYAWASGVLFAQALKALGPNPTRSGLLQALSGIHNFDANGFIAPADVGAKKPATCIVAIQVDNGKFVRRDPTSTGFYCTNAGFFNYKAS